MGYPSEAGLYNDIDAVADKLMESYSPDKICIYGSCGESFSAIHLFRRFHSQGINLILDTAPASLNRVISRINRLAAYLFPPVSAYLSHLVKQKEF